MRRTLASLVVFVLLAVPLASGAQPAARVSRIGFLWSSPSSRPSPLLEAFRQRMRDIGWAEGRNIAIEYRSSRKDTPSSTREVLQAPPLLKVEAPAAPSRPAQGG